MNELDLTRMLRELRHRSPDGLGDEFSGEVMLGLGGGNVRVPSGLIGLVVALSLLLSAAIGCSIGLTHRDGGESATPPPLIGFGASEMLASR